MNRKMRRDAIKREKAQETADVQRLKKNAERTIKKVVRNERKTLIEAYGLDNSGRGFEEYHTAVDTFGSVSCMYSGDLDGEHVKYAAITASAGKPELEQAFRDQLSRSYENLNMPLLGVRDEKRMYLGESVKVVLSQMHGDFWTVYLGSEGLIDKLIETGAISMILSAAGYAAFWNEWEIRLSDDKLALWENLMHQSRAVFFHAMEWPQREGKVIPAFDIMIPEENIVIQREGEAKIPYGRQVHPTSNRLPGLN